MYSCRNFFWGDRLSFSSNLVVDLYSISVLAIILLQAIRSTERDLLQQKLFMTTLFVTAMMLVIDVFSRFDGRPDTFYAVINQAGNFLIFLLSPVLPSLWLLYAYSQVTYERGQFRRWLLLVCSVNAVNTVLLIMSQFFGWFYTIGPRQYLPQGAAVLAPRFGNCRFDRFWLSP